MKLKPVTSDIFLTLTNLLGVHEAVVVQVLVVHGETAWKPGPDAAAEAGTALDALAHHQHGIVEHAL